PLRSAFTVDARRPAHDRPRSPPEPARREPGARAAGRPQHPRRRPGTDDRPHAVSLTQPQHALRRLERDGRAVDDDRQRARRLAGAMTQALLVLRDGRVFRGRGLGARGETSGEVIFNTAMQGYQEILTDPSYRGQIVVMTYPLIGNYGVNEEDVESRRPWVNGFIVREASLAPSSWRGRTSLGAYLKAHDIVGLQGIDTRALTRHLRDHGAQDGLIASGDVDETRLREK